MQRVMGYALTGVVTEQCFWLMYGGGSNGKSTLLETMEEVLGEDFCWHMPFPSASWSDALSDYQKAALIGRRYVTTIEKSNRKELSSELVKALTGNRRLDARPIYGAPINFSIMAKFFLAANDPPVIEDTSEGMWRRVKMVPFLQSFPVDPKFAESLLTEKEGIFTWAVEGCLKWQRDGMQHPKCVDTATGEYRLESDPFAMFIAEHCQLAGKCVVGATELYKRFESWDDGTPMSQRAFGACVRQLKGVSSNRYRDGYRYSGIGLLDRTRSDSDIPLYGAASEPGRDGAYDM